MHDLGYTNALAARRMVEVLDRTFRIYREHFVVFVVIVACVTIPMTLLEQATQIEQPAPYWYAADETTTETPPLVTLLRFFLQIGMVCVIAYSTSEITLGRRASVQAALNRTVRRSFTILFALILIGIISIILFVVTAFVVVLMPASLCMLLPLFLMIAFGYFIWNMTIYLLPTIILERVGFALGIRRSMTLAKRQFWPNFWFVFHLLMIVLVLSIAFSQFTVFILGASNVNNKVLVLVIELIVQIIVTPIAPIGLTLMYYNTRIQTEGLDLALMTVDTLDPRPVDVPSPIPRDSGVTSQDVRNIVILALSFSAIILGFYLLALMAFD